MTEQSPETLEGRLNAQREVLAVLLACAMRDQDAEDLIAELETGQVVQDHQEDPGALPDRAFSIEAAAAQEMQLLLEQAKAIRDSL